ncbi:MAG: hypothetical protein AAGD35_20870 [Actinomycetota bacterium]
MTDHRPLPPLADGSPRPQPATHAYDVKIDVYVKMSFGKEAELRGAIGSAAFTAESELKAGTMHVKGEVDGQECHLKVRLRRFRPHTVTGEVHGQPIKGALLFGERGVVFEGMAGREDLRYNLESRGRCSNHGTDLGIHVDYQPLYCEIVGGVDRIPDGAMIALLVPAVLARNEPS